MVDLTIPQDHGRVLGPGAGGDVRVDRQEHAQRRSLRRSHAHHGQPSPFNWYIRMCEVLFYYVEQGFKDMQMRTKLQLLV